MDEKQTTRENKKNTHIHSITRKKEKKTRTERLNGISKLNYHTYADVHTAFNKQSNNYNICVCFQFSKYKTFVS